MSGSFLRRMLPVRGLLAGALVIGAGPCLLAAEPDLGSDAQREAGAKLYAKYCSQCHGDKGDGAGYAAPRLRPAPRNFTTAKYKIRTTPNGALPTHEDLERIIHRGMPYTSMPAWPAFSDEELSNLAYHLKTFAPEFANPENVPKPVELPGAPSATEESVAQGAKLYVDNGCVGCHGNLGRGDGPSAPTLVDDWGHPLRAADLTQRWTFRGGATREDIFRTLSTGLNGTPMPSYFDAIPTEQRWALTDFIASLSRGEAPGYANLVIAKFVEDPIELAAGAAAFEGAPAAHFPVVGQIIEPVRSFHPPATELTVQAIYDAESIAILVRWHDMSAQKSGKNGPALQVPIEEEGRPDAAPGAAAPGAEEGGGEDIWGEEAAPAPAQATPAASPAADDIWGEETGQAESAAAPSEFSDAVAIQLPAVLPTGARKPYFIFGDTQNPVDLWFMDFAGSEPSQFIGRGSADITANDTGDLTAAASYDQGEWSVIFKRPLRPSAGVTFAEAQFVPIAFSVWDGYTRERGNRRGLTLWYHLYVSPKVVPSPLGPMLRTGLIVLALELIVIAGVRWTHGARKRTPLGASPAREAASHT